MTKQSIVFKDISDYKLDVVVLSETKKKGNGSEKRGNYVHIYSGVEKEKRARAGVSIAINAKLQKSIKSYEAINERLITLDLLLWGQKILVIGVYAPNDDAKNDEKEEFFDNLTLLLNQVGSSKQVIIMGDLNGRTGRKVTDEIVGNHGEEVTNDNGRRLIEVCDQFKLKILNGYFQHKNIHKYTRTQPTLNQNSIIDYIITRQTSQITFQDVRVHRGTSCSSDHFLVKGRATIRFKHFHEMTKSQGLNLGQPKYNLECLQDESTVFLYKLRLAAKIRASRRDETLQQQYNFLQKCVHEAANEALGQKNKRQERTNEPWWTEDLENIVEEKKRSFLKWQITKDKEDRKYYNRCNYNAKKEIKKRKNEYWEKCCQEIDQSLGHSKSKRVWKTLNTLKTNTREKVKIDPIGIENWKTYYRDLLTEERPNFKEVDYTLHENINEEQPITRKEVQEALKYMKNNKAAGPGGLPIELVKYSPTIFLEKIAELFTKFLEGNQVPEEWKEAYLSSIHKKGSKLVCENYRGISVTSSVGRLYGRILKNRIEQITQISEEQSGFRPGRSCVDNIFCLKQLAEKTIAHNRELHLIFIDLKKAYDTVPVTCLWEAMKSKDVPITYINAIKQLYARTTSRIKVGQEISAEFVVNKGLRQGCCISPTLFKIYIDRALTNWRNKCYKMGVQIGDDDVIYSLLFADDQVILAEDEDDANYMFRKLVEEFEMWGLEVNMDKTKYMVIGAKGNDLRTEKGIIENITEYKYLGVTLTSDGRDTQDIQSKIQRGKNIIRQLHPVIWNDQISKRNKKRIFRTFVESTVTYGAETWAMTKNQKEKINATEMMFWRRSCKKTIMDKIPSQQIREEMQVTKSLLERIEEKQLIWYGHMIRMDSERLPLQVWKWKPKQNKKRGRPRKTWKEEVSEAMRKRGLSEATIMDRKAWKFGCGKRPP